MVGKAGIVGIVRVVGLLSGVISLAEKRQNFISETWVRISHDP